MHQIPNRVAAYARAHALFDGVRKTVVALSGGPDSVALTLILLELQAAGQLVEGLHMAHLNHGLRGEESDAEEKFCRRFAERVGLEIKVGRADVAGAARGGGSLEAVARRVRYDFLRRVAKRVGAGTVATGHQADDVAESVLLRMIRGAGVTGLGAMAPRRPLGDGVSLVRPLLEVPAADLRAYLKERGEAFCADSSNLDTRYARNRVRHDLMPKLREDYHVFSPHSLVALNESALEVERLLRGMAEDLLERARRESAGGELVLDAAALAAAAPPVRKMLGRLAVERLTAADGPPALRAEHYREIARLPEAETGTEVTLPGGLLARREHGVVYFASDLGGGFPARSLSGPGVVDIPHIGWRIEVEELPPGQVGPREVARRATNLEVYVNAREVAWPVEVRARRPGDRFFPLGAPGSARLKEFFINTGVPQHERDRTPLLVDARGEIVWVVGHRIGEPFRLVGRGEPVLRLKAGRQRATSG